MTRQLKILLVEDRSEIYRQLQRFLESKGHRILQHSNEYIPFIDNYSHAVEVIEEEVPDLAILDIEIKGDKNGLQLGEFISDNYWLPIIYLTSHYEKENRTTAGYQDAKGFIAKVGKPLNKLQLELDVDRIAPIAFMLAKRRTLGDFFTVSEIDVRTGKSSLLFIRKKVEWEQVKYITTVGAAKNKVVFHLADGSRWSLHEPLVQVEKRMPPFIMRFTDQYIVNIKFIDRAGRAEHVYYIDDARIEIGKAYRDNVLLMIRLFFPSR